MTRLTEDPHLATFSCSGRVRGFVAGSGWTRHECMKPQDKALEAGEVVTDPKEGWVLEVGS